MYTIHYERDGCEHRVPVVFTQKQPAMENACELLRLGFRVLRVQGPGLSIGVAALQEYRRETSARVHGQTALRRRTRHLGAHAAQDSRAARQDRAAADDGEMEAAGTEAPLKE
jgi:hypothetical protein